ncbi:MAG: hypothetical protein ABIQ98_07810 [Sphingomicrobium sp.]
MTPATISSEELARLVTDLRAIGEEEMYLAPASTHATINEAADAIEALDLREQLARVKGGVSVERLAEMLVEFHRKTAYSGT